MVSVVKMLFRNWQRMMALTLVVLFSAITGTAGSIRVGSRMLLTRENLYIRSDPSISGSILGTQSAANASGIVVAGPVSSDGFNWWKIDFDSGPDGWMVDDYATEVTTYPLPPVPLPRVSSSIPLQVSPDGHFLQKSDGTPFFWMGDTAWVLPLLSPADIESYFADCAAKQFNVSQINLNFYDTTTTQPYLRNDTDNPNEAFWQKIDWMISAAESYGIYTALTVMWAQDYDTLIAGDASKAYRLGKWLGSRYKNRGNVIWIVSGEYSEILDNGLNVLSSMAQGIRDGGGNQLITAHPAGPPFNVSSSGHLHYTSWLGFNMVQSGTFSNNNTEGLPEIYYFVGSDYGL
jgi:hypothetical protein